ncbi:MAG TPA: glycosyltransferase [Dehalococcoidia bacterium]|nr:glycosyltransferase [Dehalococcoidia bacterium]
MLHYTESWLPQTQTWQHNQLRFMPEGIECFVACERTQSPGQFPVANLNSFEDLPVWSRVWQKAARKAGMRNHLPFVIDLARKAHIPLLHTHFGDAGWAYSAAAQRAGLRHVVGFYGFDMSQLPREARWRERFRDLFARVDRVLCCWGPVMANQLLELGCPEAKLTVQHLAIDLDAIPFVPRQWDGNEPLRVLIAGRFAEKKGITYAIDSLARVSTRVPIDVTIIGDASVASDLAEKQAILDAIERGGLVDKVRMLGFQPQSVMFEEAYKHHVYLSPSVIATNGDTEGGAPVAVAEMMATGMPVVATHHCDIYELMPADKLGVLLAPEREVDGLVDALMWLVEHPRDWQSLAAEARENLNREFNPRIQGERLAAIYRQVMSN